MLVLSRCQDESVLIKTKDTTIKVMVCRVQDHGKVRLGFDAPRDVRVDREEVHYAKGNHDSSDGTCYRATH